MPKKYMDERHFEELLQSVRQMGLFMQGKKVPGLKVTYRFKPPTAEEVKALRKQLHLTQEQFAMMVGEGLGAVRTWEQGLRNPGGAASKLIRYVREHPETAKELVKA